MNVVLLRHGRTVYNDAHRYQGRSDIPLSQEGAQALRQADFSPACVYVSPLQRARQTARILFPDARLIAVPALTEMDFGVFEGKNYIEMEHDAPYRAWVDGGCTGKCPGGESLAQFQTRVCAAFETLAAEAIRAGKTELVIVAHGGTQMAVLERFAQPKRDYFSWQAPCGGGFRLQLEEHTWNVERKMHLLDTVQFTKG